MTPEDDAYILSLLARGLIKGPCLELGTGYGGPTAARLLVGENVEVVGTDLSPAPGVELVIDFESSREAVLRAAQGRRFATALVLNVLEHTFEPVTVLDNVGALLEPGGRLVLVAPAAWPLHNFPQDCYRLLPDFYVKYARSRKLAVEASSFEYLGIGPVSTGPEARLPRPTKSKAYDFYSRVVHRVFNTTGRAHWAPGHLLIGVVMTIPGKSGERQVRTSKLVRNG
jgi:SAM-dependent methyltransferase